MYKQMARDTHTSNFNLILYILCLSTLFHTSPVDHTCLELPSQSRLPLFNATGKCPDSRSSTLWHICIVAQENTAAERRLCTCVNCERGEIRWEMRWGAVVILVDSFLHRPLNVLLMYSYSGQSKIKTFCCKQTLVFVHSHTLEI